jgi:protein-S-isoprenylcysteine O-methyltransferase Ste14
MTGAGLALGYHLASRLAYAVGVGVALTLQDRRQIFTRQDGVAAGFRRFRRLAALVMNNDVLSLIVLCVVTRDTIAAGASPAVLRATGALFVIVGLWVKFAAARQLGAPSYYWHNFFAPDAPPAPAGPYRYLRNPMYTVGYLPAYGVALLCGSWLGLWAAAFDQIAILTFYYWVEKPHFERLQAAGPRRAHVGPVEGSRPPA